MSPTTIALIIGLIQEAIKEYPAIAADFQAVFSKPNPTPADWLALRDKVLAADYKSYVPDSKL